MELEFQILGAYPADGMAFWFVEEPYQPGSAFGYKENFRGLGIFMDTYKNNHGNGNNYPRIGAMIGDGLRKFDHYNDGRDQELASCQADIVNTESPIRLRVVYVHDILEVYWRNHNGDFDHKWKKCFIVVDVKLPKKAYIGVTAQTGAFSARHRLMLLEAMTLSLSDLRSYEAHHKLLKHSGSFSTGLIYFVIIVGIIGIGIYWNEQLTKRHNF